MIKYQITRFDSGVRVRADIRYESAEQKVRNAEMFRDESRSQFEELGASWDGEFLGWWFPQRFGQNELIESLNQVGIK